MHLRKNVPVPEIQEDSEIRKEKGGDFDKDLGEKIGGRTMESLKSDDGTTGESSLINDHAARRTGGGIPFLSENLRSHGERNRAEMNEGGFSNGLGFGNSGGEILGGGFGFQQSSGVGLPFGLGNIGISSGVGVGK